MTKDQQREIEKVCAEVCAAHKHEPKQQIMQRAFMRCSGQFCLHANVIEHEVIRFINAFTIPALPPREDENGLNADYRPTNDCVLRYEELKAKGLVY